MKKISLYLSVIVLAIFTSCSQDDHIEDRPVLEMVSGPQITAPESGESYVFTFENEDDMAERFTFTDADFNFDSATTYSVEIDSAGGDFSNPQILGSGNQLQIPVTVEVFNNAALALGLNPGEASEVDFRIKAAVGSGEPMYSETRTILVTPYTTEAPVLYVVGNFLSASGYGNDWEASENAPHLAAPAFGETNFEGYVYMNVDAPEFKFLPNSDNFDNDYGDAEASGTSGMLEQENEQSNMKVDQSGYYRLRADTNPDVMTWSALRTDWGVIGNATPGGWDNDTDMVYDPETQTWSVTLDLTAQQAPDNGWKFRANDAWDLNLGDYDANGTLEEGGDNISVPESGNYTIILDLSDPRNYTYSLTLND